MPAAHLPGFIQNILYLIQAEFSAPFRRTRWDPQPTVTAVVVAPVGEIQVPSEGDARKVFGFFKIYIAGHHIPVASSQPMIPVKAKTT
jgi:hypothetical protein